MITERKVTSTGWILNSCWPLLLEPAGKIPSANTDIIQKQKEKEKKKTDKFHKLMVPDVSATVCLFVFLKLKVSAAICRFRDCLIVSLNVL